MAVGFRYLLISGSIAFPGARMATLRPETGYVFEIVFFSSASYYPEHEIGCISMLGLLLSLRVPIHLVMDRDSAISPNSEDCFVL